MIKLILQRYRLTQAFEYFYNSYELEQAGFTVTYEMTESEHHISIHNISKKTIFTVKIKPKLKFYVDIDHLNFRKDKKLPHVDPGIWSYKEIEQYMVDSVKEEED